MKEINCLRCDGKMNFLVRESIQLGRTGLLLGDLPNLLAGALEADIYVCPECKRIELFYAEDDEPEEMLPKRTCPECGYEHDFDYPKCPRCKFDYYR